MSKNGRRCIYKINCVVWAVALVLAKYLEARCNDMQDWLRGR